MQQSNDFNPNNSNLNTFFNPNNFNPNDNSQERPDFLPPPNNNPPNVDIEGTGGAVDGNNMLPRDRNAANNPQNRPGNNPTEVTLAAATEAAVAAGAIAGTEASETINGTENDDLIFAGLGNDTIAGGEGTDIVSYLGLNSPIIFEAGGVINKGLAGTDQLGFDTEQVVAPEGQPNTIDASTGTSGVTSVDFNLEEGTALVTNVPSVGEIAVEIENFVNAIGTGNNDTLTGSSLDNALVGGFGDDLIDGGAGNDVLIGTDNLNYTAGSGEIDQLTGGAGQDLFVLGNTNFVFYQDAGNAVIQDFESGVDRIQLSGSVTDYTFEGNSILLAGTTDLVATVNGVFSTDDINFV